MSSSDARIRSSQHGGYNTAPSGGRLAAGRGMPAGKRNPAGPGHRGRRPLGKTQTPSRHSPKGERPGQERQQPGFAPSHRTTTCGAEPCVTSAPAGGRILRDAARRWHPGQAGPLPPRGGGPSRRSVPPEPPFPPWAPRRCLCTNTPAPARTARGSGAAATSTGGGSDRKRQKGGSPLPLQRLPAAAERGRSAGSAAPRGADGREERGSATGGTRPRPRSPPLGQTPARRPPGPTHTAPPWWTCCRPAVPRGAAERRPPGAVELPVPLPERCRCRRAAGRGAAGGRHRAGARLKGQRAWRPRRTASSGATGDLGCDGMWWGRGNRLVPGRSWDTAELVELGAAEPGDVDKRRRCPGLRRGWRCPRPAPRELQGAGTAVVARPGAVLGAPCDPGHGTGPLLPCPPALGSSCVPPAGSQVPPFPTCFHSAPSTPGPPRLSRGHKGCAQPQLCPSPSPDPSHGDCPRTKVGKSFVQLWWEYSNNNKTHLLQEKSFHCCASHQLPQCPDLTLPGLRNEQLDTSFLSETFHTGFLDPHTSEKDMWKQQYFISQDTGVLVFTHKKIHCNLLPSKCWAVKDK